MSVEYRDEQNRKAEDKIRRVLENAPSYMQGFYQHISGGTKEVLTQLYYVSDVVEFMKYEKEMVPSLAETDLKDFPMEMFTVFSVQDLNEYRDYLHRVRMITNASSKRYFSSLSVFYKYLNAIGFTEHNPMRFFSYPALNRHRIVRLDADLSSRLLTGVLANDKYLLEGEDKPVVISIPETVQVKRDRLVLRNYAILRTFLGTGLRCSELVGLDLQDINFSRGCFTVVTKGGDENEVYFGEAVAEALKMYLDGTSLPSSLTEKYGEDELEFCRKNAMAAGFARLVRDTYPEESESFYRDMEALASAMRRQGRSGLGPKKNCEAVFITTRGGRMTVRAVELMVKEMVRTYLPDYPDKDIFSPHKLRATCATRILSQTGNVQLASQQLNHKSVAVTARFYAELQKEQQKAQVQKLNVDEW